jgi:hypothetical protein
MLAIGWSSPRVSKTRPLHFSGEARVIPSFSDRVEVPKHVLVRFVEKESVFLNLETECYYGLDETGTRMWQVVIAAPTIENAFELLLSEFDVEAEPLRENLSELLGRLVDLGLLRVHFADVKTNSAI